MGNPGLEKASETGIAHAYSLIINEETTSVRKRVFKHGQIYPTVHRILRIGLHLHPYKAQISQQLSEYDLGCRLSFCRCVQEMVDAEIMDLKKKSFSLMSHIFT